MKSILTAKNLQSLSHEGAALSPEVSFDLHEGEVLFLQGENGAGKSSLVKTLLGLNKNFKGHFDYTIPRAGIQYLPQLGNLDFHLPLTLQDMLPEKTLSSALLQGLDLQKKWNTASGGERQKVLLAAVLAKEPALIVLDEPFNHVDQESIQNLELALHEFLKQNPKSSLIVVSHRAFVSHWPSVRHLEIR